MPMWRKLGLIYLFVAAIQSTAMAIPVYDSATEGLWVTTAGGVVKRDMAVATRLSHTGISSELAPSNVRILKNCDRPCCDCQVRHLQEPVIWLLLALGVFSLVLARRLSQSERATGALSGAGLHGLH